MKRNNSRLAQAILGITIVIGFFAILILYLTGNVDKDNQVSLLLVGSLSASFGAIVQYYFGSSSSSSEKNELLAGRNPYLNATNSTFQPRGNDYQSDGEPLRYKEQSDGRYYREPDEASGEARTNQTFLRRKANNNKLGIPESETE